MSCRAPLYVHVTVMHIRDTYLHSCQVLPAGYTAQSPSKQAQQHPYAGTD